MSSPELAPSTESLALEYIRLIEEGWEPDLEEFLHRVPDAQRAECETRIKELMALNGIEVGAAKKEEQGLDAIAQEIPPHEDADEEEDDLASALLDDDEDDDDLNPFADHPDAVETEVGDIALDREETPAVKVRSGFDELMSQPTPPAPVPEPEPAREEELAAPTPRPRPRTLADLGATTVPDEDVVDDLPEDELVPEPAQDVSSELYPAEEVEPDELEEAPAPRFQIRPPERKEKPLHDQLQAQMREVDHWSRKGDIPQAAGDKLITVYRQLIADKETEDAAYGSRVQVLVAAGAALTASAAALTVLFAAGDMHRIVACIFPVLAAAGLLAGGVWARLRGDDAPATIFTGIGALALVPATVAVLVVSGVAAGGATTQLFPDTPVTNFRLLVASVAALVVSLAGFALQRRALLAWTSTVLAVAAYGSFLLTRDALAMTTSALGLWLLPLVALVAPAAFAENRQKVRWATPLYLVAGLMLVLGLDAAAPRLLTMLGTVGAGRAAYLGFAAAGVVFAILMIVLERFGTVSLRRAASLLEPIAVLHLLIALHLNAAAHGTWGDVCLYAGAVVVLLALSPWRGRPWVLVGGLVGIALASALMIQLALVGAAAFTISAALLGLLLSVGVYAYLRRGAA